MSTLIEALKRAEALRKLNEQDETRDADLPAHNPTHTPTQSATIATSINDIETALIAEEARMATQRASALPEQQKFSALDQLGAQKIAINNDAAAKKQMREAAEAKVSAAIAARTIDEAAALSAANERLIAEENSLRVALVREAAETALAEARNTNSASEREFAKLARERAAAEGAAAQVASASALALSVAQEKLSRDIADLIATRDAAIAEKISVEKQHIDALNEIQLRREQNQQAANMAIEALHNSKTAAQIEVREAAEASREREALQARLDAETALRIAASQAAVESAAKQRSVEEALKTDISEKIAHALAAKALALDEQTAANQTANDAVRAAQAEIEAITARVTAQEVQALQRAQALTAQREAAQEVIRANTATLAEREAAAAQQIQQISEATAAREAAEAALADDIAARDQAHKVAQTAIQERLDIERALSDVASARATEEKYLADQQIALTKNERAAIEAAAALIRAEAALRQTIEAKLAVIDDANQLAIDQRNRDQETALACAAQEAIEADALKASINDVNNLRNAATSAGLGAMKNGRLTAAQSGSKNPLIALKLPEPKPVSKSRFWLKPLKYALIAMGFVGLGFFAGNKIFNDAELGNNRGDKTLGNLARLQADAVLASAARKQADRALSIANNSANSRGEPIALKLDITLSSPTPAISTSTTAKTSAAPSSAQDRPELLKK